MFVSVADRDKRADDLPGPAPGRARLHASSRPRAPPRCCARNGIAAEVVRKYSRGAGADGERIIVDLINAGEIDMVVNTPERPARARADGYEIRAATTRDGQADHHHGAAARGGGAGHRGASITGDLDVTSLQDHAAGPRPLRRGGHGVSGVVQVSGELIATRRVGAYHHLTLVAPGVAELARPGQFVALAVGGPTSAQPAAPLLLDPQGQAVGHLRRHRRRRRRRARPGHACGSPGCAPTTRSTSSARSGGRSRCPREPVACVLVGGGYGAAPLFWLAEALRERGCHVEMVLGAATEDRLFGVVEARRTADGVTVTTDDGSSGHRGWVTDVLRRRHRPHRGAAWSTAAARWRCCARSPTSPTAHGAVAQVAVEESMACGVGVCMTCVMPVTGDDGVTRMVRSCVEGPVFRGDRVRWDAFGDGIGRVPDDALGAPRAGGH